jgi:GNAT superfamily N-acetyltransferase
VPGSTPAVVRRIRTRAEWQAVRELCCLTGDAGRPIALARWPLFAALWIGPYERLAPAWTYVGEIEGRIVGYLTGCPDTLAFERARLLRVTLPALAGIATGRYRWTTDARALVRLALGRRRRVETRLASRLPTGFLDRYPAHLHMNVAAQWRSHGIGRALVGRYTQDLEAAGVAGVHLFCGPPPLGFYLREGFVELGRMDAAPGRPVHALGRRLG